MSDVSVDIGYVIAEYGSPDYEKHIVNMLYSKIRYDNHWYTSEDFEELNKILYDIDDTCIVSYIYNEYDRFEKYKYRRDITMLPDRSLCYKNNNNIKIVQSATGDYVISVFSIYEGQDKYTSVSESTINDLSTWKNKLVGEGRLPQGIELTSVLCNST